MSYQSTKIIDGFSTVFRQWKALSHCNKLHGYSLKFEIVFEAEELDQNNWVVDFGFLKNSKFKFDGLQIGEWFKYMFDHTTIVAQNDPAMYEFKSLDKKGTLSLRTLSRVGCEAFAELVYNVLTVYCNSEHKGRVKVKSVTCIENEKNSATYGR